MKPKVLIAIDTRIIGGPGKGLIQFLKCGGNELCEPVIVSYWRGEEKEWQFGDAIRQLPVKFEVLKQKYTYDPLLIYQAYNIIKTNNIQILQSHGYKSHILCFILKIVSGLPWIAYVHGWTAENVKMKLYAILDQIVLKFADKIVTVSENLITKLNLNWINRNKILTIKNAIELENTGGQHRDIRGEFNINKQDILIGIIGRFSPEKGQVYIIEAMDKIQKKFPNVTLIFVGDGQDRLCLQNKVKEMKIDSKVIFAGFQPDVCDFYKTIDILVMPSLSEGMPNVALEAMMFGVPVVATNVGGIPEVVVNQATGLLVDPMNPEQMAAAICHMLINPELLKSYGEAGQKRVANDFNPYQRAKNIANVYSELLGRA